MPAVMSNLRVRPLCLLLLAVIPGFGLTSYLGYVHRQQAVANAEAEALQLARLTAVHQERLIETERQLLATIAELHEVFDGAGAACQLRLAALLRQHPRYAYLAVVTADGLISCSGLPLTPPVSATPHAWLQRAMQTRTFAVGDYQVGTITGKATMKVAYPILDAAQEIRAIVFAALDLDWLNQRLAEAQPSEGATLTMIDPTGTIVAHYPDPNDGSDDLCRTPRSSGRCWHGDKARRTCRVWMVWRGCSHSSR